MNDKLIEPHNLYLGFKEIILKRWKSEFIFCIKKSVVNFTKFSLEFKLKLICHILPLVIQVCCHIWFKYPTLSHAKLVIFRLGCYQTIFLVFPISHLKQQ